jgi:hypothetical protein
MSLAVVSYSMRATLTKFDAMLRLFMTVARNCVKIVQSEAAMLELSSMRKAMSTVWLQ